jgi:hypothetical protein
LLKELRSAGDSRSYARKMNSRVGEQKQKQKKVVMWFGKVEYFENVWRLFGEMGIL